MKANVLRALALATTSRVSRERIRTAVMRGLPVMAVCASVFMTGCKMGHHRLYAGADLSEGQVAYIRSVGRWAASPVRLLAVDGQRGPHGDTLGYSSRWDGSYAVDVLPGDHVLTVRHVKAEAESNLSLTAIASHKYVIKATTSNGSGQYLIYDKTEDRQLTGDGQYPFTMSVPRPRYYHHPVPPIYNPAPMPAPHHPSHFR